MIKPIKKIILILIAAVMALSMAPLASAAGESVPDTRNGKVAFSGAELQWIAGHGPLSVGWLSDSDPYIFTQDGETAGAAVLYIRKLAQLMSLEVSFEEYSDADGLVQALKSGKVDFAAAFFYSENEAEDLGLLLTNPYYNANFAVISSPDSSGGESSLTAYSAGCCRSYLDRALPGCTALTFPTDKACVDAVADGSVCRAVIESYSAQELLRRSQYGTLSFKLLGSAFPCRFASADPELVNVLNTAIDGLDASVISSEATNITVASVDKYRQSEMESSRVFYIAATDAMCFALILLVVIYFLVNSRFLTRTSRSFMGICLAAMLRFASDAVQSLANGREGSAALTLNQISILAVYISGPIMAFMVGMFLYDLVSER